MKNIPVNDNYKLSAIAAINLKNLGMGYIHKCLQSQNISSAVKHIECN